MNKKIILLTLLMILLVCTPGCTSVNKIPVDTNIESKINEPVEHITNSANSIDDISKESPLKNEILSHTDNIRTSVLSLTYQHIDKLYNPLVLGLNKSINDLKETNENLITAHQKIIKEKDEKISDLQNIERKRQTSILTWAATILLILSGGLLYLGQKQLAALGGLISIILYGVVQVIGHPLFVWIIFGTILASIIITSVVFYKQKIKNETGDLTFETLEKAYNEANDKDKIILDKLIFDKFSKNFDSVHKKFIRNHVK